MFKRILVITISTILMIVVGFMVLFRLGLGQTDPKNWGINPENLPNVVTDQDLQMLNSESERIYGFIGKDLSEKDLSGVSIECLTNISFDQNTKWPVGNKLPKGFDPDLWVNTGRDPGLNISQIHEAGITGKGVTVAVIDKPILSTHKEFQDRMTYVKVGSQTGPHFHGLACASILAGKTCGVANEARIFYFATPDASNKPKYYIDAINKIITINKSRAPKEKIKIVSISDGIEEGNQYWGKWQEALKKAETEGLVVVYSNLLREFTWGGCDPSRDRNNPLNYKLSEYFKGMNINKSMIIVPGDFRTTAANNGVGQYVYWGVGGFSWAIPYVTGLAALAWQVNPDLRFDQIIDNLIATKTVTAEGRFIINPEAFINSVVLHQQ